MTSPPSHFLLALSDFLGDAGGSDSLAIDDGFNRIENRQL
jgi:hypothetical protein